MNFKILLEQVSQYVTAMFAGHADHGLLYHNKAHTEFVVASAIRIGNHYQLSDSDFFVVVTAAWFHDTGYLKTRENHESEGVIFAVNYLQSIGVEQPIIEKVKACIMATKMPQIPKDLLQEIICDADMSHFGSQDFAEKNKLLRKEIEAGTKKEISKEAWRLKTIELMEKHHYFTDYCRLLLNDKKKQNLEKLKGQLKDEDLKKLGADPPVAQSQEHTESAERAKKNRDIPERGIETMFRITSANNQRLSDMADGKAHILITVNSIILSAIISLVLRKLDTNNYIIIPTFMLLTVSVLSIIFAILSTRPAIPRGIFSIEDIEEKKVNLLFFGNFYRMGLDDYSAGMKKVMSDKDLLYHTLIMDVYSQGVVLGRKYRQLRIAYNIFMFGLIFSVLAFVIAVLFHTEPVPVIPH